MLLHYPVLCVLYLQAANNLIVLAREDAGAEKIYKNGGIGQLVRLLETEKNQDMKITAIRVLACMCKDSKERVSSTLQFKVQTIAFRKMKLGVFTSHVEKSTIYF